jgi:hypothetical protein
VGKALIVTVTCTNIWIVQMVIFSLETLTACDVLQQIFKERASRIFFFIAFEIK